MLRITPINEEIVHIQFKKGQLSEFENGYWDRSPDADFAWSAKESKTQVQIKAGKIVLQADKKTGALQFFDAKGRRILEEKAAPSRQIEVGTGITECWNYFEWSKSEKLYAKGILKDSFVLCDCYVWSVSVHGGRAD